MSEIKIILYDSDEAAQPVNFKNIDYKNDEYSFKGWISANGYYYTDEHVARVRGCTHRKCAECDTIIPYTGYTLCPTCRDKNNHEEYLKMPYKAWDETGCVVIHQDDQYFGSKQEIKEYCEEKNIDPKNLDLCICIPQTVYPIDPYEIYEDMIFDGGDLPVDVIDAFQTLNKILMDNNETVSWIEGDYRTDV